MKRLVLTELGGHPLTLRDVGFLQDEIYEGLKQQVIALAGISPCILWGMNKTVTYTSTNTVVVVSEGAYWDGNEILHHPTSLPLLYSLTSFNIPVFLVIETNNAIYPAAIYRNGQSKNVYTEKYIASTNAVTTSIPLESQPRMDNILKQRLGINTIVTNLNAASSKLDTTAGLVAGLEQGLANTDRDLSDHIATGGHTYQRISNKPYHHGNAFLSDPGSMGNTAFFNSNGNPLLGGTPQSNVRIVAQSSPDSLYEIKLPGNILIPNSYQVIGNLSGTKLGSGPGSYGGSLWNDDNDATCVVVKKENDKFHLAVKESASVIQSLWFEFMIVDLSKL